EEIRVEIVGELARPDEQFRGRGPLETEDHARGLDLGAASVRAFDLVGGGALRQHRAGLVLALLLVQDVHAGAQIPANARMRPMCSGKHCSEWSPPSRITVRAPAYLRAASRQSSTSSPVSRSSRYFSGSMRSTSSARQPSRCARVSS